MANTGVKGKVTDTVGNVVGGLTIKVFEVDQAFEDWGVPFAETRTSITGEFSIAYAPEAYGSEPDGPHLVLRIINPITLRSQISSVYPKVTVPILDVGTIAVKVASNIGVKGKLVDKAGNPTGGLTVQAYDVDPLENDLLGSATTTDTGEFSITYDPQDYEDPAGPDLKLVIQDSEGKVIGDTPEYSNVTDVMCDLGTVYFAKEGVFVGTLFDSPGMRPCCKLWVFAITGREMTYGHKYGGKGKEDIGTVYTCGAGFLDLGHLRDLIDLTRLYARELTSNIDPTAGVVPAGKSFSLPFYYTGTVKILKDLPTSDIIQVARSMAYDQSVFHEIYSYWVRFHGFHTSSFSPEDLVSNWLGTYIGGKALRAVEHGGIFDTAATKALDELLNDLGACSWEDSIHAFWLAKNIHYWVSGLEDSLEYLRRRNFAVNPINPWKVPSFAPCSSSSATLPSGPEFDLPLSLKTYYEMILHVPEGYKAYDIIPITIRSDVMAAGEPATMSSSNFGESGPHIKKIREAAKISYGPDADKQ